MVRDYDLFFFQVNTFPLAILDNQQSEQENAGVILWDEQFEVEHEEEVN